MAKAKPTWVYKCKIHGLWLEWGGLGQPWVASPDNAKEDMSTAEIMADTVTKRVDALYQQGPAHGFPVGQVKGIVRKNFDIQEWAEDLPPEPEEDPANPRIY